MNVSKPALGRGFIALLLRCVNILVLQEATCSLNVRKNRNLYFLRKSFIGKSDTLWTGVYALQLLEL
jgi:hypothetical protein